MRKGIDFIIPTYENPDYLIPCVRSVVLNTVLRDIIRVIVVNNGSKEYERLVPKFDNVEVITPGRNLGWEGGLRVGLERSDSQYVCFLNDDTFIPMSSHYWLNFILPCFDDPSVAAVGPTTNVVSGAQNIFWGPQIVKHEVPYLIGFCMFNRRLHLDAVGSIDDALPGGDDFDLSIRYRKMGYKLIVARTAFIYHHGFKTGERLKGNPAQPSGWNSREMIDKTNRALIKKHGFRDWIECLRGDMVTRSDFYGDPDIERTLAKKYVTGDSVVDLGCGASKTVEHAIGVDQTPPGEKIMNLNNKESVADVISDVSKPLPFEDGTFDTLVARHVLEHISDQVTTIQNWARVVKEGGRIILALPDARICNTILLNPEHKHEYTPEAISNFMQLLGFKPVGKEEHYNGMSFLMAFEKNGSQRNVKN